jgi:hypothetical protein
MQIHRLTEPTGNFIYAVEAFIVNAELLMRVVAA